MNNNIGINNYHLNDIDDMKQNIMTDSIQTYNFLESMMKPTNFLLSRCVKEIIPSHIKTKWGDVHSHKNNGLTYDFFIDKTVNKVFVYSITDIESITIKHIHDPHIMFFEYMDIIREYYGLMYKNIKIEDVRLQIT